MPHEPIRDPHVLEALEACRPHRDDLSDPGLAFLTEEMAANPGLEEAFTRLQGIDSAISRAFQDVPVPEGLADRLLRRLTEPSAAPAAVEQVVVAVPPSSDQTPASKPTPTGSRIRRRYVMLGIASLAAAGCLLAAVVLNLGPRRTTLGEIEHQVLAQFQNDVALRGTGQLVVQQAPPKDHPFSGDVRRDPQMRWRTVNGLLGKSAVAYDLSRPGGSRATLYVLPYSGQIPALPNAPPLNAMAKTQNRSVALWRKGPLLYVLVVEGGPGAYRGFLDSSRPLA